MDVRMIARRTDAVGGLIVVPFVALFLMILSRNPYFDAWDWPPSLVAILAIQSLIALLCAVRLRRAAERARSRALERLVARLSRRLGSTRDEDAAAARQLRQVMEEIRDQRQGAFSHWFQNPVVRAVLMPFGGVGVLALIDTLVKAGV
jgi:hypothetical protein